MNAAHALTKAKSLIENPDNWIKEQSYDGRGRYCAHGARQKACGVLDEPALWLSPISILAAQALYNTMPDSFQTVGEYNDHPTTTHKDILDWFDRAIEYAKQVNATD